MNEINKSTGEQADVIRARRKFFSPWPKGAPIESWAEHAIAPTIRCLARYVLHVEARVASLEARCEQRGARVTGEQADVIRAGVRQGHLKYCDGTRVGCLGCRAEAVGESIVAALASLEARCETAERELQGALDGEESQRRRAVAAEARVASLETERDAQERLIEASIEASVVQEMAAEALEAELRAMVTTLTNAETEATHGKTANAAFIDKCFLTALTIGRAALGARLAQAEKGEMNEENRE